MNIICDILKLVTRAYFKFCCTLTVGIFVNSVVFEKKLYAIYEHTDELTTTDSHFDIVVKSNVFHNLNWYFFVLLQCILFHID